MTCSTSRISATTPGCAVSDTAQPVTPSEKDVLRALNIAFSKFPATGAKEREEQIPTVDPKPLQMITPPTDGKWILVKLPGTLIRYEGSVPISSWPISGGKRGHPTPTGTFLISAKDENHTSSSYGTCGKRKVGPKGAANCKPGEKYVGADMRYYQKFAPSIGLHRGDEKVKSHGCIHVRPLDAVTLWKWSPVGTPVVVCEGAACDAFPEPNGKQITDVEKNP